MAAPDLQKERVKRMFSWTVQGETSPPSPMGDEKESKMSQIQFSAPYEKPDSTTWQKRQQAVCVRHAFKHYGSNKRPNHVLSNLNMTVAKGTIYGLLGASGCGKTTLLSCIVGRRKLNSGEIWVLGGKPGTKGSGVPGKRVGYMPQEIALYGEFTIKETMMYFGWIFGMSTREIIERLRFLLDFLDLPSENRMVKNLSGGQQRRVSFAVALMHDPELLILDEPTVGVDPLLRQSIWTHLVRITSSGDKTVIITTHYIEEARQAHCIGLMRSGRLLAEESPQALLTMYSCVSLEDVFLKLSRKQGQANQVVELNVSGGALGLNKMSKREEAPYATEEPNVVGLNFHQSKEVLIVDHNGASTNGDVGLPGKMTEVVTTECEDCGDCFNLTSRGKIKALIQKNFLRMWRNIGVMLFIFVLPVMQVILFCLAIGRDPSGLKLAVVNNDVNVIDGYCPYNNTCSMKNLSCRYLDHLKNQSIIKEYYADLDSALNAVREGDAWGALYFNENYTDSLVARLALADTADDETIESSEVQVWLDMSNQQIGLMLNRDIQFSYRDFAKDLLQTCDYNPKVGDIPIDFMEPIYGDTNPSFTDFVAPGVILTIVFFLAVALTSSALIVERTEGLLDRSWVAGVSPGEILFSHVVTQFVVMCGQTALVLIFMILVFGVKCNGNVAFVVMLTLMQGLCGMCFGFVISAACELERNAIQLALGSFYPTLLLSGVIWPIEGMPWILRYVSLCLPLTLATSSLRSILTRGWPITDPEVYMGFVSTLIWIAVFLALTITILKFKRGQANQVVELNVSGGALGLNKMSKREEAPYATEEPNVVGLNFHQSKEVLIVDHNGASTNGDVGLPGKMTEVVTTECEDCGDCFNLTSRGKIKALIQMNFLRMGRNIGVMLFIFVLPVMLVILFCLAIGRDPSGLKLAVVNNDVNVIDGYCPYNHTCSLKNLSCRYLDHLKNQSIIKEYYADLDSALNAVREGDAWGALYFNENYTDSLVARMVLADTADDETIESSEVQVWLDMSNQQIGLMLNRDIQFSYRDFAEDLLQTCDYNPKVGDIPIGLMEFIYGDSWGFSAIHRLNSD